MENQHRKITGYRELEQKEIDLMNKVKALGAQLEDALEEVRLHVLNQEHHASNGYEQAKTADEQEVFQATMERIRDATPQRFIALAKTEFQTGLMYLTRAVAQPTFF